VIDEHDEVGDDGDDQEELYFVVAAGDRALGGRRPKVGALAR
jgi:hypothetical protein